MQIQRINNNFCNPSFTASPLSLRSEIAQLKNPTKEVVRDLYGTFGLDIYEGKQGITILSENELKRPKNNLTKIFDWITGNQLADFAEEDTLKNVVFKYAGNKKCGLVDDIETKFGKRGTEEFKRLFMLGYIDI